MKLSITIQYLKVPLVGADQTSPGYVIILEAEDDYYIITTLEKICVVMLILTLKLICPRDC